MGEGGFRLLFGALWVLFSGLRVHYQGRIPRGLAYVRVDERRESALFRTFAIVHMALPMYALTRWLDFAHVELPAALRYAGALIGLGGVILFGWAHRELGRNWTGVLALLPDQQLVTSGPYARVRHPMYTAFFTIGIAFALVSANALVAALYLGTFGLMYLLRVPAEERMMEERFGDAYRAHRMATCRLWPRLFRDSRGAPGGRRGRAA